MDLGGDGPVDILHMDLGKDKAAIGRLIGKGGKTLMRIRNATGCSIELFVDKAEAEIRGMENQMQLAALIIRCILTQPPKGDMVVESDDVAENCSNLVIPRRTIKMVLGKGGEHLHSIEEENNTIMFFARITGEEVDDESSRLIIFGDRRGRRLSQLLVMGLVESIVQGCFTDPYRESGLLYESPFDIDGDWGTVVRELNDEDELSYVIGKNASTRTKLMRTTGCVIARVGPLVFISGELWQRTHAEEYIDLLLQQRHRANGYVAVSSPEERDDCTLVYTPDDCVAYVTGVERGTLLRMEETWGVMIFVLTEKPAEDAQTFAIFGPRRSRCGAELKMKTLIEAQRPGFISNSMSEMVCSTEGFDTKFLELETKEASYVCGKHGATAQKLATASNTVVQIVGDVCVIGGEPDERQRCHDYIGWLLVGLTSSRPVVDTENRSDVTEIKVPNGKTQLLTPDQIREFESESGTYILMAQTQHGDRLLICGHEEGSESSDSGRFKAERLVNRLFSGEASSNGFSRHGSRDDGRSEALSNGFGRHGSRDDGRNDFNRQSSKYSKRWSNDESSHNKWKWQSDQSWNRQSDHNWNSASGQTWRNSTDEYDNQQRWHSTSGHKWEDSSAWRGKETRASHRAWSAVGRSGDDGCGDSPRFRTRARGRSPRSSSIPRRCPDRRHFAKERSRSPAQRQARRSASVARRHPGRRRPSRQRSRSPVQRQPVRGQSEAGWEHFGGRDSWRRR